MDDLTILADKYDCDKGSIKHNYTKVYNKYFHKMRNEEFIMLEIGYGKGASINMWREYFPKVTIYCIDISDELPSNTKRIKFITADQSSRDQMSKIFTNSEIFKIIIDDGSHISEDQQYTFGYLFPYLSSGGLYIIEDLNCKRQPNKKFKVKAKKTIDVSKDYKQSGNFSSTVLSSHETEYINKHIENMKIYNNKIVVIRKNKLMDHDYSKWNNYTIGNIPWSRGRKNHLSKIKFIEYVVQSSFTNILEVGAGEVWEGQAIRKARPDINHTILDVSDTFLNNAKNLGFKTIKGEMHNTGLKNKEFDLVYLAAVLEHTPDLERTFEELRRVSDNFYFSMFKWKNSGGLKPDYHEKRKYFTTVFNINKLLNLLSSYGTIDKLFICTEKGKIIDWDIYKKKISKKGIHRNGNYLSIVGRFNK